MSRTFSAKILKNYLKIYMQAQKSPDSQCNLSKMNNGWWCHFPGFKLHHNVIIMRTGVHMSGPNPTWLWPLDFKNHFILINSQNITQLEKDSRSNDHLARPDLYAFQWTILIEWPSDFWQKFHNKHMGEKAASLMHGAGWGNWVSTCTIMKPDP